MSTISAGTTLTTALVQTGDTTGELVIKTDGGNTTAMTITTAGNVGIGTSSPNHILTLQKGSGSDASITMRANGNSAGSEFYVGQATDNNVYIYNRSNFNIIFGANNTQQAFIANNGNFGFNSGYGSVVTAYGCRAWVNFNGTGTVAIRGSGNVTSITDNGSSDYTVNFTTAMPDVNYSPSIAITKASANTSSGGIAAGSVSSNPTLMSTTQLNVVTGADAAVCSVAIFR
jgi:hypothetical protein